MTTAVIKDKADGIQDRVRRLAELGSLSDKTKATVEEQMDAVTEQLDEIDRILAAKLGKAERRVLKSFDQHQPSLF